MTCPNACQYSSLWIRLYLTRLDECIGLIKQEVEYKSNYCLFLQVPNKSASLTEANIMNLGPTPSRFAYLPISIPSAPNSQGSAPPSIAKHIGEGLFVPNIRTFSPTPEACKAIRAIRKKIVLSLFFKVFGSCPKVKMKWIFSPKIKVQKMIAWVKARERLCTSTAPLKPLKLQLCISQLMAGLSTYLHVIILLTGQHSTLECSAKWFQKQLNRTCPWLHIRLKGLMISCTRTEHQIY